MRNPPSLFHTLVRTLFHTLVPHPAVHACLAGQCCSVMVSLLLVIAQKIKLRVCRGRKVVLNDTTGTFRFQISFILASHLFRLGQCAVARAISIISQCMIVPGGVSRMLLGEGFLDETE